jgi:imidazolonepropionase-like amidohydrolase
MRALLGLLLLGLVAWPAAATDLAVRGEKLYTMNGEPIADGVVLIAGGKIEAVGPASSVSIPAGVETFEAAVVTPGLIDAHTVVGLSGYLNQPHDQDQLERSEQIQPELRAIDSYNALEELIDWVRSFGVTTIHTGHAPGLILSGQTMIAKTRGGTLADAVIRPEAMLAVTLGQGTVTSRGERKSPGTRAKAVAMLRGELVSAQTYLDKRQREDESKHPPRDLRMEALSRVLEGQVPLLINVQRHNDILTALRLAEEFDIPIVLDGVAEVYLVLDEVRAAGHPIILHPTMRRAFGDSENLSLETAALLAEEGIVFALQSSYESYVPKTRVVLFEAALATAYGLPFERALATITIDAATILGIDDRVGSLEVGKDADVALYDGDPFEYTSHCIGVLIDGEVVSDEPH